MALRETLMNTAAALCLTGCASTVSQPTPQPTAADREEMSGVVAKLFEGEVCMARFNQLVQPYGEPQMESNLTTDKRHGNRSFTLSWAQPGHAADCGTLTMGFKDSGIRGDQSAMAAVDYLMHAHKLVRQTVQENLQSDGTFLKNGEAPAMYEALTDKLSETLAQVPDHPVFGGTAPRVKTVPGGPQ